MHISQSIGSSLLDKESRWLDFPATRRVERIASTLSVASSFLLGEQGEREQLFLATGRKRPHVYFNGYLTIGGARRYLLPTGIHVATGPSTQVIANPNYTSTGYVATVLSKSRGRGGLLHFICWNARDCELILVF